MPKINHEEYEVLKELDDKWKWVARDNKGYGTKLKAHTSRPDKMIDSHWSNGDMTLQLLGGEHLFQFIQWEDEEPYNIAELIEEYEIENGMRYDFGKIKVVDIDTSKLATKNGYIYVKESEHLLDQLDEPEVLSQEWIDGNSVYASSDGVTEEYVHVDDLQNLLVPTLSEMETVEITEEPETVADVIADFFKSLERLKKVMSMEVEELEE